MRPVTCILRSLPCLVLALWTGLVLCTVPAGAAKGGSRGALHYEGTVGIAPESGHLSADWTIWIGDAQVREITFLLDPRLGDIAVGGPGMTDYRIEARDMFGSAMSAIAVDLAEPGASGSREVTITYGGVLKPAPTPQEINTISPDKVELSLDSMWFPFDASFTSELTADLTVSIPGEWTGVSTGQSFPGEDRIRIVNDDPNIDLPLTLLRDYRLVEAPGYVIYDTRPDAAGIDALRTAVDFCTDFLNGRFGADDPLPRAKIVVHDRAESGYSRKTMIALSDIGSKQEDDLVQFICHELGHYWSSRARADTVENWLNETFADYVGLIGVREALGEEAFQAWLAAYHARVEAAGEAAPVWVPGATERGSYVAMYRKGPLALARLEDYLGRPLFDEFLRRYMTEEITTTPALLTVLEEVAGVEAREQFTAWLAE